MTKHDHHCECKHEEMRYCKKCDTAYCAGCNREWPAACQQAHYPDWAYTWTQPLIYGTTTVTMDTENPTTESANDVKMWCAHGDTVEAQ